MYRWGDGHIEQMDGCTDRWMNDRKLDGKIDNEQIDRYTCMIKIIHCTLQLILFVTYPLVFKLVLVHM